MAEQTMLISVANKEGITEYAQGLLELDWGLLASGGTADHLNKAGLPVTNVAELVGGGAILGHRVVTLARKVYAGLLADLNNPKDVAELETLGIPQIHGATVDMYDLRTAIAEGKSEADIIEATDVGGPTMLHAAAKGRRVAVSSAAQRPVVLQWLQEERPDNEAVLRTLAAVAENEVAQYIGISATYLGSLVMHEEATNSYDAQLRAQLSLAR